MAGSAEKRPRDGAGSPPAEGRRSKRRRWDSDAPPAEPPPPPPGPPAAAGAPAAAAGTPLPDTSALAKARAVLAKQKALAEKLKKLKKPETAPGETASEATTSAAAAAVGATQSDAVRRALEVAERARAARAPPKKSASATATTDAPRALLLNAKGEEVDEEGNVVLHVERAVSTFKVNAKTSEEKRKVDKLEAFDALRREAAAEAAASADAAWVDPSVTARRRGGRAEFKVRLFFLPSPRRTTSKNTKHTFEASFQSPAAAADRTVRGPIDAGTTGCDTDDKSRRGGREFGAFTEPRAPRRHKKLAVSFFCVHGPDASYTLSRGCSFLVAIFMLAIAKLGRWKADARMAATPSPERHAFRFRFSF